MIAFIIGICMSYVIGSIPTAYIVGKVCKGIDIRFCGSGNVGATNVFRSVGKKWGIFVLLLDITKGLIVVCFVSQWLPSTIASLDVVKLLYGTAAIIGHNWTIFLQFKGGKGVATTCGVILGFFPMATGLCFLVFVVVVWLTKYVSFGSIIAAVAFPGFLFLFYNHIPDFNLFFVLSCLLVILIIVRHRSNIIRLMQGKEHKITFGS